MENLKEYLAREYPKKSKQWYLRNENDSYQIIVNHFEVANIEEARNQLHHKENQKTSKQNMNIEAKRYYLYELSYIREKKDSKEKGFVYPRKFINALNISQVEELWDIWKNSDNFNQIKERESKFMMNNQELWKN